MTDTPRTLRTPTDILTAIPDLCGFMPVESLVVLPLNEQFGGAVLRIDLPTSDFTPEEYAAAVLEHLLRFGDLTRAVVAVFTHASIGFGTPPHTPVISAFEELCELRGVEIVTSLLHARDGWCEYFGTRSGTLQALHGSNHAPGVEHRQSLTIRSASAPEREQMGELLELVDQLMPRLHPLELLDTWEELERFDYGWDDGERELRLAVVTAGMQSPALLGLLLHHIAFGAEGVAGLLMVHLHHSATAAGIDLDSCNHAEELMQRWLENGFEYFADSSDQVEGSSHWRAASEFALAATDRADIEPVDLDRCTRAVSTLRDLISRLPRERTGDAYAVLAWLSWAMGHMTAAEHYATKSLGIDRQHEVAHQVVELCARGNVAGWIGSTGCTGGIRDADLRQLLAEES